jgi:hypothetical protein
MLVFNDRHIARLTYHQPVASLGNRQRLREVNLAQLLAIAARSGELLVEKRISHTASRDK